MAYASMHHLATYNPQLRRSLPRLDSSHDLQASKIFTVQPTFRSVPIKTESHPGAEASVGREGDQGTLLKLSSSTSRLQVQLFRDNPIRHRFSASNIQKAGFHLGALPFSQGFLCHHAKDSVSFRTM